MSNVHRPSSCRASPIRGCTKAVPVAPLVSRKIPLEDLQRGMEEALGGGPVMKVLVDLTA